MFCSHLQLRLRGALVWTLDWIMKIEPWAVNCCRNRKTIKYHSSGAFLQNPVSEHWAETCETVQKTIPQIESDIVLNGQSTSNVVLWFFLTICLWQLTVISVLALCRLIGYWCLVIKTSGLSLVFLSQAVMLGDAWPVSPSAMQNGPLPLDQLTTAFEGITCNCM